jgi:hypothetical protein
MTIPQPLLICGIAAFCAVLTIGVRVTTPTSGPRLFLTGKSQIPDLLKMGKYSANIELIETPEGARVSVTGISQAGNESGEAGPRALDTFIVR